MIRVLIADDQPIVRAGLAAVFDAEPDLPVVGSAADGHEAEELALALRPDVICMDIRMPGRDGIEATRRIVDALGDAARVLVLTTFEVDEHVFGGPR